jgi:ATP-binding cassette subfamily B protein
MSTASVSGVTGEERDDLSRTESRSMRKRSQRLLLTLLRPLRKQMALTLAVVILSTAAQVAGPTLVAVGIDQGVPALAAGDWLPLVLAGGGFLASIVMGSLLIGWYRVLQARISQAVLFDLRRQVFRQTQGLSIDFHESYTSGRIIARQTSDLDSIRELLDEGLGNLVSGVFYTLFTALALVLLDPQSGLVLAVAVLPLWFLVRWFQTRSQRQFRVTRTASARLIVQFVETMTGIRAVKAFRKEEQNREKFAGLTEDYRQANAGVFRLFGTFEPGLVLIGNVTVATVLLFGGLRVASGELAIGALLAILLYVRRFFDPLQELAMFYNGYQSASAALEKISGVLEERPSVADPAHPVDLHTPRGAVRFDGVEFGYRGGAVILPRFDLDIPAGQTIALVGSTGAGKSTLAKLVSRFYDPSEGAVLLDGLDLRELAPAHLRRAIVMVTQEAYLFSGSVADNIALGKPDATRQEIVSAAKAVGAHAFIEDLPQGYDTDVNKRGGRVSAGQRQLLSFARAFLADPAVLILDEATASLDIPSERAVQDALQTLLSDRTALIIAHRLSTVAIADRVLVMERGRVVEDGTPEQLIGGTGRFASLHAAWRESLV